MITQWWGVAAGGAGVAAAGEAAGGEGAGWGEEPEMVAVAAREGRGGSGGRPVPVPPVSEPGRGRRAAAAAAAAAATLVGGTLSAKRCWARDGGEGLGGITRGEVAAEAATAGKKRCTPRATCSARCAAASRAAHAFCWSAAKALLRGAAAPLLRAAFARLHADCARVRAAGALLRLRCLQTKDLQHYFSQERLRRTADRSS